MAIEFSFTRFPFDPGEPMPTEYTCDGSNISPPLAWDGAPEQTTTFALLVDDPDAPGRTFTHWVCYNIPGEVTRLPRDVDFETHFDDAEPPPEEGVNDFGDMAYGGPCPPPGDAPHRYFIRLYALDTALDLGPGATREQLTDAMEGHILDETDLVGVYGRSR